VFRVSPWLASFAVCVSSFIRLAIGVILPFLVLVLVVQPVVPAPLIIRISVEPAFVPVLVSIMVPVLISLTFLLVITTVFLRHSGDQPAAAKR
jgi:hypothetical protein